LFSSISGNLKSSEREVNALSRQFCATAQQTNAESDSCLLILQLRRSIEQIEGNTPRTTRISPSTDRPVAAPSIELYLNLIQNIAAIQEDCGPPVSRADTGGNATFSKPNPAIRILAFTSQAFAPDLRFSPTVHPMFLP
jgi:hypothetical protein